MFRRVVPPSMVRCTVRSVMCVSALCLSVLGVTQACVSGEMELPPNHPANPEAETSPAMDVGHALRANFDALAESHEGHEHAADASSVPADAAATYTCPMHPEVVKSEPGNCPICGMKLVPVKPKEQQAAP